jgi:hypothetical protein
MSFLLLVQIDELREISPHRWMAQQASTGDVSVPELRLRGSSETEADELVALISGPSLRAG